MRICLHLILTMVACACASPDHGYQVTDEYFGTSSVAIVDDETPDVGDSAVIVVDVFDLNRSSRSIYYDLRVSNTQGRNTVKQAVLGTQRDTVEPGLYSISVDGRMQRECGWATGRAGVVAQPNKIIHLTFFVRVPAR